MKDVMHYEEMKDSGLKWVGEVPRHWGICRLKNISNQIYKGNAF